MSRPDSIEPLYGTDHSNRRRRRMLRDGRVPVAVYGLGKMGLPLAAVYADLTGNVIGADVDSDVVATINDGDCHIDEEPGLADLVSDLVADDALRAVDAPSTAASSATVHAVIVPTLVDEQNRPDLSTLEAVTADIGSGLSPGDLVIVESTVPPRTCRTVVLPTLEAESGLSLGEFGLAFCPERTSSGHALRDIRGAYPKVVGGADEESAAVATLIYESINTKGVVQTSDVTVAEAVKVFEGLYRDVNIALVNELARFADELGVDVNEAIDVANTQPFVDLHTPGAGVGGHCIPYYPYFVINQFETDAPLLQTARNVNDRMPTFAVERLREGCRADGRPLEGATVLVLGLTYRPGVDETRASPARTITAELARLGADVRLVDPLVDDFGAFDGTETPLANVYDVDPDAAILVTAHEEFESLEWTRFDPLVVVDGRQSLALEATPHRVYTVGSGWDGQ